MIHQVSPTFSSPDTSALAFDNTSDVRAVIGVVDRYDEQVSRTVSSPVPVSTNPLSQATQQAIDASSAYNRMLVTLETRRLRLQSTQADLETCYHAEELRRSLAIALAAGIDYSLLRSSYHIGRKQLGSIPLPIDKQLMVARLRESRKLQSLQLSTSESNQEN